MTSVPWRVLAADDDPTAGLLLQVALGAGEFALTLVDNGNDALAEFQRSTFDIALLDVEMPGLDGFEVCSAIRKTHSADFPVLLVTGRSDPAFLERASQLSAGYIAKPVNWTALPGQLLSLLNARSR